jgi:uncharacterized membrane protein
MAHKQLVLAIFASESEADAAAEALKRWDDADDDIKLKSTGILALDERGQLKTDKVGRRSIGKGAGIGVILAMATPVGAAAVLGGAVLGALHHKGLGISHEDRDRLGRELSRGKAAVGTVVDPAQAEAVSAKLAELGGKPETHELDDAAMAEVDAAAAEEAPQDAPVEEAPVA